jgi:NAD+ synthetase
MSRHDKIVTKLDKIVSNTHEWFDARGLNAAAVGYSGGIDSTATALLLREAGIETNLVVADGPNQRYSSPTGGSQGAMELAMARDMTVHHHTYTLPWDPHSPFAPEAAANEAALPIIRNAIFYGVAALLRAEGKKAVVVGTANFSEAAFLGFWGKASDAAQDFYPISHLVKSEVYELAHCLGAPSAAMEAVPSGDLFYTDTNDLKMIGATYVEIEKIIMAAEYAPENLWERMCEVDNVRVFLDNILRNSFKYELPFPNHHLYSTLEDFRKRHYPELLRVARKLECTIS